MKIYSKLYSFIFLFIFSISGFLPLQRAEAHGGSVRDPEVYRELLATLFSTMRIVDRNRLARETGYIVEQGGIYYSMDRLYFSAVIDKMIDDLTHDEFRNCEACRQDFKQETRTRLQKALEATTAGARALGRGTQNVYSFFKVGLPFMAADYVGEYGYMAAFFKGTFEVLETVTLPIHGLCWLGDGVYFLLDFPLRHVLRARGLQDQHMTRAQRIESYRSFMLSFNRLLFSFTKIHRKDFPVAFVKRGKMIDAIEQVLEGRGEAIDVFFDTLMEREFFTRPQNWSYGSRFLNRDVLSQLPSDGPSVKVEAFEDILLKGPGELSREDYVNKLRTLAQIEYSQHHFILTLVRAYVHSRYLKNEITYQQAIVARRDSGRLGTAISKLRFALHGIASSAGEMDDLKRSAYYSQMKTLREDLMRDVEAFTLAEESKDRSAIADRAIDRVNSIFYKDEPIQRRSIAEHSRALVARVHSCLSSLRSAPK